jgi:hypothetical protein
VARSPAAGVLPPSPSPVSARPSPPASAVQLPPPAPDEGDGDDALDGPRPGEDDGGVSEEPDSDWATLGGRWDMTHEIEATSYAPFAGMRLGYRLDLRQQGNRVWGRGRKYTENGALLPPDRRTPITVDGRIEGQYLVMNFVEQGGARSSAGTIRWLISPGAGALSGRFASDAAQSSGTSSARRLQ